jgi:hypothetical protein
MDRRVFLTTAGVAGLTAQMVDTGVGVIGSGGRGRLLEREFREVGAVIPALCDVYEPNLQEGQKDASTGPVAHSDQTLLLDASRSHQ